MYSETARPGSPLGLWRGDEGEGSNETGGGCKYPFVLTVELTLLAYYGV